MGAWETECQISQNYILQMKVLEFYLYNHDSCEIWRLLLGLPWEIFFGGTTDHLLHLKPLKNVKKNAIFFKLFCYKIFVPWKLKLLNFLVDSILSWFWTSMLWSTDSCHNRVSTDQCHMTVLGAQVYNSILSRMFFF